MATITEVKFELYDRGLEWFWSSETIEKAQSAIESNPDKSVKEIVDALDPTLKEPQPKAKVKSKAKPKEKSEGN